MRVLNCPKCTSRVSVPDGQSPACGACGYGTQPTWKPVTTAPAPVNPCPKCGGADNPPYTVKVGRQDQGPIQAMVVMGISLAATGGVLFWFGLFIPPLFVVAIIAMAIGVLMLPVALVLGIVAAGKLAYKCKSCRRAYWAPRPRRVPA